MDTHRCYNVGKSFKYRICGKNLGIQKHIMCGPLIQCLEKAAMEAEGRLRVSRAWLGSKVSGKQVWTVWLG